MQVLWKSSDASAEVRCSVCWQGFALYWDRHTRTDQAEALEDIVQALKNHHCTGAVHPAHDVHVPPAWDGPIVIAGTAILGNAPNWPL